MICRGGPKEIADSLTPRERERLAAMLPAAQPEQASVPALSARSRHSSLRKEVQDLQWEVDLLEQLKQLHERRRQLKNEREGQVMRRPDVRRAMAIAEELLREVGSPFTLNDLRSPLRTADICEIRCEYYRRARAAGLTLNVIGLAVNKDHGTVLHGLRAWEKKRRKA